MRGEVHILVWCPIDTLQWGSTHSAMFNSISILTLVYFSILLNHDGTIIMETITEQRTQKLFNLSIYQAFQPESKNKLLHVFKTPDLDSLWMFVLQGCCIIWNIMDRVEVCRDRRDRRSCKICASFVNFPRKQRHFSHNLRTTTRFTHTKGDFALKLLQFYTLS